MRCWGKRRTLGRDKERGRAKETERRNIIHSFNKYLMSFYYMSGSVPGAEDTVTMKTGKVLTSMELLFYQEEDHKLLGWPKNLFVFFP